MNLIPRLTKKIARGGIYLFSAFKNLFSTRHLKGKIVVLAAFGIILPLAAHAGIGDTVVIIIGEVVEFIVQLLGKLLIAVIDMLVKVAQYNDYADSEAVNIGWVVTRDLANMLFIIALIVISFGTILQWEQYRYNRLLGKLVLTAVIVNFSKSITLFLIDFSQVIMMTFVNAFKDVAAGNLTTGFGIRALLTYANSTTSVDINVEETVMIYALAIVLILVALIVTLTLVVVLVRRIISLWVLIIMSPLAFIASVMPGGVGNFNTQWWRKLGSEMFVGPTLAFFLWLSFSIIFIASGDGTSTTADIIKIGADGTLLEGSQAEVQAVVSEIGSTKNLFNFLATIILLIHSMSIAKEAGGFAGNFAQKASQAIDRGGAKALKGIIRAPKALSDVTGATGAAKRVGYGAADAVLNAGSKIPLVGNRIAVTRGKLAGKRKQSEEQDKKDLSNVSKDSLMQMANGRGAVTERGRALQKGAMESLIDSGDSDDLTENARLRYQDLVGYEEKAVQRDDGSFKLDRNATDQPGYARVKKMKKDHPEFWYDGMDAKLSKDPNLAAATENKFNSELNKFGKAQWVGFDNDAIIPEKSRPEVMGAIHDKFQEQFGDQFTRDDNGDVTGSKLRWWNELSPTKKEFFSNPPPTAAGQEASNIRAYRKERLERDRLGIADPSIDPQTASNYARQSSRMVLPANGAMETEIKGRMDNALDDREKRDIASDYEQFAQSNRLSKNNAAAYQQYHATPPPLADATKEQRVQFEEEQIRRAKVGLSGDITSNQMREAANAHSNNALQDLPPDIRKAFNDRLEKNKTPEDVVSDMNTYDRESSYESPEAFEQARGTFERKIKDEELQKKLAEERGEEVPDVSLGHDPIARLQSEMNNAEKQGRVSTARFMGNFEKLGLNKNQAGVNMSGAQKTEMIPKLQELFSQQLKDEGKLNEAEIASRVEEFGQQIGKAENLAIANTGREGFTSGQVLRHENAHPEIDKLSDAEQEEVFSQIPQEEQQAILGRVQERWDYSGLTPDQTRKESINEYLTEGLANYGRSNVPGEQLNPDIALALKSKGAKFRAYTDVEQDGVAPTTKTVDQLEMDKRGQEVKVQEIQNNLDQRVSEIENELPAGVTTEHLQDPNPLVQKEVEEKGTSPDLVSELKAIQTLLKAEKGVLGDINVNLRRQMRADMARSIRESEAFKQGIMSADEERKKIANAEANYATPLASEPKTPESGEHNTSNTKDSSKPHEDNT